MIYRRCVIAALTLAGTLALQGCSGNDNSAGEITNATEQSQAPTATASSTDQSNGDGSNELDDPTVATIKQVYNDLTKIAKQCYDAPNNESKQFLQCREFVNDRMMQDSVGFKLVPVADSGQILTGDSFVVDNTMPNTYDVYFFDPEGKVKTYHANIYADDGQIHVLEGEWTSDGLAWLDKYPDYSFRWSR